MINLRTPVIAFTGHHNAGKTLLLEKVIDQLTREGLRVGTIKHHGARDLDFDIPGKDSGRHARAGATRVVMVSPTGLAEYHSVAEEPTVQQVLSHFSDVDVILSEGYKHAGFPSIAVARSETDSAGTLNVLLTPFVVAVACDDALAPFVPQDLTRVNIDDVTSVCALVKSIAEL